VLVCGCLCLTIPLPGYSEDFPCLAQERHTFTFSIENDFFTNDDDQYTNGLKLTWSRFGLSSLPDDAWLHKWFYPVIRRIKFDQPAEAEKILSFSIGQSIYTPDDIDTRELIEDDRPYAGITYFELGFHRKLNNSMHTIGLCAGIVGPDSYADETQTAFHDIINSTEPEGWSNQLENEPVICLIYDYKKKLFATNINEGFGNDITINTGGSLGTAQTFYNIGLLYRWGWNIPADFGNFPIELATCFNAESRENFCVNRRHRFGAHLFLSADARLVLRDIFLDGNTFRHSHSVDRMPVVGTFAGGLGFIFGRAKIVASCVYQTDSFEEQQDNEVFGSLSCSFYY